MAFDQHDDPESIVCYVMRRGEEIARLELGFMPRAGEVLTIKRWPETRYQITSVWHKTDDAGRHIHTNLGVDIMPRFAGNEPEADVGLAEAVEELKNSGPDEESLSALCNRLAMNAYQEVLARREEILAAFIAKYGCEPDEIEQVEQVTAEGMRFYVRRRAEGAEVDKLHDRIRELEEENGRLVRLCQNAQPRRP